jgi:hypothetical protein
VNPLPKGVWAETVAAQSATKAARAETACERVNMIGCSGAKTGDLPVAAELRRRPQPDLI